MGWRDAFWADIYREPACLSAFRNGGRRLFDIGVHAATSNRAYGEMVPFRWGGEVFGDGKAAAIG